MTYSLHDYVTPVLLPEQVRLSVRQLTYKIIWMKS